METFSFPFTRSPNISLEIFPVISFAHAALSCRNFASQHEFRVQIKMFIALSGVRTVARERPGAFLFRYPGHAQRTPLAPLSQGLTSVQFHYFMNPMAPLSNGAIMSCDCHFRPFTL